MRQGIVEARRTLSPKMRRYWGGEILEALLVVGLIVVAIIFVILTVRGKTLQPYDTPTTEPPADSAVTQHLEIDQVVKVRTSPPSVSGQQKNLTLQIFSEDQKGDIDVAEWVLGYDHDNGYPALSYVCDVAKNHDMWVEGGKNDAGFSSIKIHVHDLNDVN